MKQYLNLIDRIIEESFNDLQQSSRYKVSFDSLAEIMGVPVVAVSSIARVNDIVCQGEWIEENSLGVYEDAYIRKLKVYFKRMMRHGSETGYSDQRTFIDFCKTFKKPNVDFQEICCWDNIDEDAIREQFRLDLEKVSKPIKRDNAIFDLFAGIGGIKFCFENDECGYDNGWSSISVNRTNGPKRSDVLRAVIGSVVYRHRKWHKQPHVRVNGEIRGIVISAHYYIYCREDKDNHHLDAVKRFDHNGRIVNSTLMMVA